MAWPRLPTTVRWLALASLASAQSTIDDLSFGIRTPISTTGHGVPGWHASSVNHDLQVLSDRIILTPPIPGSAKGALWSEHSASTADWTATLDFRASGQETGSGNLQIWYTKDRDTVETNSVYNVEKFDGLVLVVDQYGNSGGKIRGFLNDGGVNFKQQSSLESLAFGHCDYSYRNLGRPSKLKISNQGGLHVSIDDRTCFSSNKIVLPAGYYFGISATTGENPDSFEVQKFVVQSGGNGQQQQQQVNQQQQQNKQSVPQLQKMDAWPGAPEALPDRVADEIRTDTDKFADLHNRLQSLSHHMGNMFQEIRSLAEKIDGKHDEVVRQVQNMQGSKETGLAPEVVGKINELHQRVTSMEGVLNIVRNDVESKDYRQHLEELHNAMSSLHNNFHDQLPEKFGNAFKTHGGPSLTSFLFMILAVQALFAGAYILYKKRRHSAPKKYL